MCRYSFRGYVGKCGICLFQLKSEIGSQLSPRQVIKTRVIEKHLHLFISCYDTAPTPNCINGPPPPHHMTLLAYNAYLEGCKVHGMLQKSKIFLFQVEILCVQQFSVLLKSLSRLSKENRAQICLILFVKLI